MSHSLQKRLYALVHRTLGSYPGAWIMCALFGHKRLPPRW